MEEREGNSEDSKEGRLPRYIDTEKRRGTYGRATNRVMIESLTKPCGPTTLGDAALATSGSVDPSRWDLEDGEESKEEISLRIDGMDRESGPPTGLPVSQPMTGRAHLRQWE